MITKSYYMEKALEQAELAYKHDEVPVGAVIVNNETKDIIAQSYNLVETTNDPTAHAEIIAIKQACELMKSPRLVNCNIYVTLEPCPMCAQAISFARLNAIYYGAHDLKGGGIENGAQIYNKSSCHHKPEIYSGIYEKECAKILKEFFNKKRLLKTTK